MTKMIGVCNNRPTKTPFSDKGAPLYPVLDNTYTYETRKTTSTTFFLTEATLTSVVSVLICCKTDRICEPLVNTN